jgi:hypothetical protein
MKTLLGLVLLIIAIISCNKDDISPTIDYESMLTTLIYLNPQGKIIRHISTDLNDSIIEETNYYYSDSMVVKKLYYSSSPDYLISWYKLGQNGFSSYSIDSLYYKSYGRDTVIIDTVKYIYDKEGYLLKMITRYHIFYFAYNDNNLVWQDYINYSYLDTLNKIDITGFTYCNGITGRINKNLIKHIKWGANGGPSTYASESEYEYTLDLDGFVIEKKETFFPAHYYTHQLQDSDLLHYLTRYKYIKNYAP